MQVLQRDDSDRICGLGRLFKVTETSLKTIRGRASDASTFFLKQTCCNQRRTCVLFGDESSEEARVDEMVKVCEHCPGDLIEAASLAA